MENFEFKSAICTSVEQSNRLLALGLKKETADMLIMSYSTKQDIIALPWSESGGWTKDNSTPAWSLHRLLEMLYADIGECMIFFPHVYDEVIADIENLIHRGTFNEDYLEEKQ